MFMVITYFILLIVLFLAFKNALRKDKPEAMAHRMQHRKHVANQRVYLSDHSDFK